jgi:hypothetical protein
MFGDVAIGTYRCIELAAVFISNNILSPVMIDPARWQVGQFLAFIANIKRAIGIGELDDSI